MNELEKVRRQRDELKAKIQEKELELNRLKERMKEERQPYQEKIDEIEKHYAPSINALGEKIRELEHEYYKASSREVELLERIELDRALKENVWTDRAVKRLLKDWGEKPYTVKHRLKQLSNGITILSTEEEYYCSLWFGLYNGRIVAICIRRKGQHQGDYTYPFAWIGQPKITSENALLLSEQEQAKVRGRFRKRVGYREWKERLEQIKDPSKLAEIKPTDKNKHTLARARWWL